MQFSRSPALVVALIAPLCLPLAVMAQEEAPLELTLYRTLAPGAVTAVDAVAEIDPRGLFEAGDCSYRVRISITGAAGTPPVEDEWRRTVSCSSMEANPRTRLIDTFSFAVQPGSYQVEMKVVPELGDAERTVRQSLQSLPPAARLSDLYLAREVAWDSAGQVDWPLRKGGIGIAAEAAVDVPTTRPFLGYYVELYGADVRAIEGTVTGAIVRPGGTRVAQFTLQTIDSLVVARPVAGAVSLAGLPVGSYDFELTVAFAGEDPAVRRRSFRMVREDAAEAVVRREPGEFERYFAQVSDSALTRFDAVVLWMEGGPERDRFRDLSPDAKRRFLAEYFNTGTMLLPGGQSMAGGEALRALIRRVNDAERLFGERAGDERRPGWQTDRGRLYVRFGPPADRISRPFPGSDTRPYEIWYYNIGRGFVYLFADESGFGNYRLLYSTDPTEPTLPDWRTRVGPAGVDELATYYGIRER